MKKFFKSKWFIYISYTVVILLLTVLESTPHLFSILGVKPILLLPFALAVAIHKGEVAGAIVGTVCGLMFDISINSPFGAYAFFFLFFGVSVGLLSRLLLQKTWFNHMFLVFVSSLLIQFLDFFFNYILYGYSSVAIIFFTHHFVCVVYNYMFATLIAGPIVVVTTMFFM